MLLINSPEKRFSDETPEVSLAELQPVNLDHALYEAGQMADAVPDLMPKSSQKRSKPNDKPSTTQVPKKRARVIKKRAALKKCAGPDKSDGSIRRSEREKRRPARYRSKV